MTDFSQNNATSRCGLGAFGVEQGFSAMGEGAFRDFRDYPPQFLEMTPGQLQPDHKLAPGQRAVFALTVSCLEMRRPICVLGACVGTLDHHQRRAFHGVALGLCGREEIHVGPYFAALWNWLEPERTEEVSGRLITVETLWATRPGNLCETPSTGCRLDGSKIHRKHFRLETQAIDAQSLAYSALDRLINDHTLGDQIVIFLDGERSLPVLTPEHVEQEIRNARRAPPKIPWGSRMYPPRTPELRGQSDSHPAGRTSSLSESPNLGRLSAPTSPVEPADRIEALHQKVDRMAQRLDAMHAVMQGLTQEIRMQSRAVRTQTDTGIGDVFFRPPKASRGEAFEVMPRLTWVLVGAIGLGLVGLIAWLILAGLERLL